MTASASKTILVVEDEAAIRDMLSFTLHRGGYAVIEAVDTREAAEKLAEKLHNISCTIAMPTGEDDKLYGEVTPELISNFYQQEGLNLDKRKIYLEKGIRHLGVYQADIKLHPDVTATVKVWVVKK